MPNPKLSQRVIMLGLGLTILLTGLGVVLPRVLTRSEMGFDAIADALGILALFFGSAVLVALFTAVFTIWKRRDLAWSFRFLGFSPLLLVVGVVVVIAVLASAGG